MKSKWVGCVTKNPEETIRLGENFADFMEKGDVYAFIGELASGKTTFIKGILKGLQFNQQVTSPTFTLVNEYNSKFPVIHIDCYREDELERWVKLGMNDYMNEENIIIVEWADKAVRFFPTNSIWIEFNYGDATNERIIKFEGNDNRARVLIDTLLTTRH